MVPVRQFDPIHNCKRDDRLPISGHLESVLEGHLMKIVKVLPSMDREKILEKYGRYSTQITITTEEMWAYTALADLRTTVVRRGDFVWAELEYPAMRELPVVLICTGIGIKKFMK
jgi:hypothetical protein